MVDGFLHHVASLRFMWQLQSPDMNLELMQFPQLRSALAGLPSIALWPLIPKLPIDAVSHPARTLSVVR